MGGRIRAAWVAGLVAAAFVALPMGGVAAEADTGVTGQEISPGVTYRTFDATESQGAVHGYLVEVDLSNPQVSVGLLHPDAVASRATVSQMADAQGAVAGVNGDFFNISESAAHPGVEPTGSSDGPEIADGDALKAAVPNGQRFGPGLPPGTSTQDVIGVGVDRRGRLGRLALQGTLRTADGDLAIQGFNQYALPVGGIGVYTSAWGPAARNRPTCGTDTQREAPCSTDTYEVTVRHGTVTAVASQPGSGQIPADAQVLVGRDAGADSLRALQPGDHVTVSYRLAADSEPPFAFAVGGFPILRGGRPLAGLDGKTAAVRTFAGVSGDGNHLYLAALDGVATTSAGLTIAEEASLMTSFGAADAVNLDGGGSTTLVARQPGDDHVTVENHPSGVAERPVANGVGVFSHR